MKNNKWLNDLHYMFISIQISYFIFLTLIKNPLSETSSLLNDMKYIFCYPSPYAMYLKQVSFRWRIFLLCFLYHGERLLHIKIYRIQRPYKKIISHFKNSFINWKYTSESVGVDWGCNDYSAIIPYSDYSVRLPAIFFSKGQVHFG